MFNKTKTKKGRFSGQGTIRDYDMQIQLEPQKTIIDSSSQSRIKNEEAALCLAVMEKSNRIAVGTKKGTIKIFCQKTGIKLEDLNHHTSGVCCMGVIDHQLISGSDIGCCKVILWDFEKQHCDNFINPLPMKHTAAVTSIVSLGDGKYALSGGFDCKVNLYNCQTRELVCSSDTGDKITDMVIFSKGDDDFCGKNRRKLAIGHLHNTVALWEIYKNTFNTITGMDKIKKIAIGTCPQSLCVSQDGLFVCDKEKWIREINTSSGVIEWA